MIFEGLKIILHDFTLDVSNRTFFKVIGVYDLDQGGRIEPIVLNGVTWGPYK